MVVGIAAREYVGGVELFCGKYWRRELGSHENDNVESRDENDMTDLLQCIGICPSVKPAASLTTRSCLLMTPCAMVVCCQVQN